MKFIYVPISLMIRPLLPRNYLFVFHLLSLISSYFFSCLLFYSYRTLKCIPMLWRGPPKYRLYCKLTPYNQWCGPSGVCQNSKIFGWKKQTKSLCIRYYILHQQKNGWVQDIGRAFKEVHSLKQLCFWHRATYLFVALKRQNICIAPL